MISQMKFCRSNKKYTGNFDWEHREGGFFKYSDCLSSQCTGRSKLEVFFDIIMCSYWRFHPFWMNFWNWNPKEKSRRMYQYISNYLFPFLIFLIKPEYFILILWLCLLKWIRVYAGLIGPPNPSKPPTHHINMFGYIFKYVLYIRICSILMALWIAM